MFRCPFLTERQPRKKNGQPAQSTTGVVRANCVQREASPVSHIGAPGTRCAIASRNTGRANAPPTHSRRVMSFSSALSSGAATDTVFGSRAMPHLGQSPG